MTEQSGGKRSWKQRAGGWLYNVASKGGWPRRLLLLAVALIFIVTLLLLSCGTDYREDPSALVPRSIQSYVETTNLDQLLRNVGAWSLWDKNRRHASAQFNQIQVDIAGLLGERVNGLGTRMLRYLAATERAAYCVNHEEESGESWALFLQIPDPVSALDELSAEQELNVEVVEGARGGNGVFKLTGKGDGALFFAVVKPWFIVSSAEILPKYATDSIKHRIPSLATSGVLPKWARGKMLRGVYNPSYYCDRESLSAYNIVTGWMAPEMRINFTSTLKKGLETNFNAGMLTDKPRGSGLWPLAWILLLLLAVICLALFFAILLVMIGWGGWLKASAMRAGIVPAIHPATTQPSEAFKEDAGMGSRTSDKKEGTDTSSSMSPALTDERVQTKQGDNTSKLSDDKSNNATFTQKNELCEECADGTTPHSASPSVTHQNSVPSVGTEYAAITGEHESGQSESSINSVKDENRSDTSEKDETGTNGSTEY